MNTQPVLFKKADDELQIVWAEVYVPDFPDAHGDFATADTIRKLAYDFMKSGAMNMVDINHDNKEGDYGNYIVESFIARSEDPHFIEGSWVVAIHIPDAKIWKMVKDGELNGFSMELLAISKESELEVNIPSEIRGRTSETAGHVHSFMVNFDSEGNFLGGVTDVVDGHFHKIERGTITEISEGHSHMFSFVEQVV